MISGGACIGCVPPDGDGSAGGYWTLSAVPGGTALGRGLCRLGRRERCVHGEERPERGPAAAAARAGAATARKLAHGAGAGLDLGPDRPVGHDLAVTDDHELVRMPYTGGSPQAAPCELVVAMRCMTAQLRPE